MSKNYKTDWISNIRGDLLAGLVVALALIPEAIAFSIIAGVDPKVGLYASFSISVVIAFSGARPGMISASTGAMALLMITLVKEHGLQYLLAATVLTGALQIVAGYLKFGNFMRFVSQSVVTGFVNALAILILLAQLPELTHVSWHVYAMTLAGLGIIYLFPYLPIVGKLIPSPLICIVALTLLAMNFNVEVRSVGDMGELPDTLPIFVWPDVPFNLDTLLIVLPYSLSLATVGLLESMMTATIVDELTETNSDKNRECRGQGLANMSAGFLGGMAGCAMIGQSMINIKSGGIGRLSSLAAGVFLLFMVVFLGDWLKQIPIPALVAVMIMVAIGTFSWRSIIDMKTHPLSTNVVMLSTVIVVVMTHNLAIGVLVGVLLASVFFTNKVSHMMVVNSLLKDNAHREYKVTGQVLFASSNKFINSFHFMDDIETVTIDISTAHFWDFTAVKALDTVLAKYKRQGVRVSLIGMNRATQDIVDRHSVTT
ncbi:SulP family inorganic anion transporter [Shewanella sp. Scap07]|uniref:SulP family inorganic anion transporter n=1 Tax=Shewanella sp. Scap07 TaxID=2589987 RepID=UPI0015BDE79F|nr:SulP family inorganic anion transporter [Shewanella sp. Scap07]QLE85336.1 SulP family inorganic anion transporter [Shewanella sp. Scap07]